MLDIINTNPAMIIAVVAGLLIIILINVFCMRGTKRGTTLIKSFEEYAKNYTYTCDGFAANLVCRDVITSRNGKKAGNLCVIGAGPKPMISELIKCFNKIYLVDPNDLWHEKWKKLDWYGNKNVIKIHDIWCNIDKHCSSEYVQFEWIIASHVFYYIKQQDLRFNMNLVNKYLIKNGKIVISVAKDMCGDIAKLSNYIQPEYQLCANIISELNKLQMKYIEIQATDEGDMDAQNKKSLINIMTMHLSDYVIDNDEYDNIIKMDKNRLRNTVSKWIDNNMKVDPNDPDNVIYHQHTAHYVVNKAN